MNKKFICFLFASLATMGVSMVFAQSVRSPSDAASDQVSLDQAVQQVQADTNGKVLSAEPRHIGRRSEYRIKVLTPSGHVRVMVIPSESGKNRALNQPTKSSPGRRPGSKEKR